ncbi:MAG: tyrosine-type recombinase/integrase [Candidatus Bathyarchaeia archaeon]
MVGSQVEDHPAGEISLEASGEPAGGVRCPDCGSSRTWRDGLRPLKDGRRIQRYLCRACGYKFSGSIKRGENKRPSLNPPCNQGSPPGEMQENPNNGDSQEQNLNTQVNPGRLETLQGGRQDYIYPPPPSIIRRVCAWEGQAENSATAEKAVGRGENMAAAVPKDQEKAAGDISAKTGDVKELLFNFAWYMKKNGYKETTIRGKSSRLRRLVKLGANLLDPESVKEIIASQSWNDSSKETTAEAYDLFAKYTGIRWEKPLYKPVRRLPFIPHERELDDLIAGCGNKSVSAFLQVAKETGARAGEIFSLRWIDLDVEARTLRITPEKGSDPRIFRISNKLLGMLENLPRKGERIFSNFCRLDNLCRTYVRYRKRLAYRLGNPRLLKISFHTFRHWKASMEYHRTKDILHVMQILGHRNIKNTLVYTQLIQPEGDEEYVCRVAGTVKQAVELVEAGFEYVCEMDGVKLFRKRK